MIFVLFETVKFQKKSIYVMINGMHLCLSSIPGN